MPRPSPQILLSKELSPYTGMDILHADSLYTVLYKQKPISVKLKYYTMTGPTNKYTRVVYPNQAPAVNLAARLNKEFNCEDFTVSKIL